MISNRIKNICSYIPPYKKIADVGCDHGYLIKEAIDKYKIIEAYAIDNKIGPLNSAKKNLSVYKNVKYFLSDGLDSLDESIEVVVIAGMGGILIKDIIHKNLNKINNVKRFILQANKNEYELRDFMQKIGYFFVSEKIIFEDSKYYEIIVCEKGKKDYNFEELYFGPCLLKEKSINFINKWTDIYNKFDKLEIYHENKEKNEILKGIKKVICK